MALLHAERTSEIRGCLYDVQNEVGVGRDEEAYHQALVLALREHDVPFVSKPVHPLLLYDEEVLRLVPDFVVADSICVEIKSVPHRLGNTELVQLFDYLKCRCASLGLLANLGLNRVFVDRIVSHPETPSLAEDWRHWRGKISGNCREIGLQIRTLLRDLYQQHTTGYGDRVTGELIRFALKYHGLKFKENPLAEATYHDRFIRRSPLRCLLIENEVVVCYSALFEDNQYNLSRCKSYLKALGLRWGVAANFGKCSAQFCGVHVT